MTMPTTQRSLQDDKPPTEPVNSDTPQIKTLVKPLIKAIGEDGDVILIVGVGAETQRYLVHSQCLRTGSRVFAAMFSPNFREGQNLSQKAPKEVHFPEDDPESMRVICELMHFKNLFHMRPTAEQALRIAVLADKYDVLLPFTPVMQHWISSFERLDTTQDRVLCLAASFRMVFKDEWSFVFDLLSKHAGSYAGFLQHDLVQQVLDYRDIMNLEETRTKLRLRVNKALSMPNCGQECQLIQGSPIRQKLSQLRTEYTATKIFDCPLFEIVIKLKKVYSNNITEDRYTKHERPTYQDCCYGYRAFAGLDSLYTEMIGRVTSFDREMVVIEKE